MFDSYDDLLLALPFATAGAQRLEKMVEVAKKERSVRLGIDLVWGRDKILAYAGRLGANKPIMRTRGEGVMDKVVLGEYAIGCGFPHYSYKQRVVNKGISSLGFATLQPIPVTSRKIGFIPLGARHPNATKLWITWSLSEEGQEAP